VTPVDPGSRAELCIGEWTASAGCTGTLPLSGRRGYDPARGLAPGESVELPVRVSLPDSSTDPDGTRSWVVDLFTNDPVTPTTSVRVSARPVVLPPCRAEVTVGPLAFGFISTPLPRRREVRVCNQAPVTAVNDVCVVSKLDVSPTSSEAFSLTQGPVFDRLINPGECLRVEVQAEQLGAVPTSPDVVVGALEATVSAPGPLGQVVVPLSAQRAVGCLVLSPSPMDFGVTQPGCRAAERTLTLANLCETDEVQVRSVSLWSSSTARPGTARCQGPLPCEEFSVVRAPDLSVGARCLAAHPTFSRRTTKSRWSFPTNSSSPMKKVGTPKVPPSHGLFGLSREVSLQGLTRSQRRECPYMYISYGSKRHFFRAVAAARRDFSGVLRAVFRSCQLS